jgi:4-alpha-glucanotransferase
MDQYLSLPEVESAIVQSESFTNWVNNNESWLESHALFSVFQAQYCCDWEQWPVNLRDLYAQVGGEFRPPNVSSFDEDVQKRVLRYKFTQWLCHQQLLSVAIYARSNGISLICDMPNIPNRVSADVWINRQLFDENYSVGTPPDVFNPVGHSWKYGIKYPSMFNRFFSRH